MSLYQWTFATLIIFLLACNPEESTRSQYIDSLPEYPPPLPSTQISVSQTLQYIADSDQYDRSLLDEKDLLLMALKKSNTRIDTKIDTMDYRDSIRMVHVYRLYDSGFVTTPTDKFNAALVFLHTGGPRFRKDSACHRIAFELFSAVAMETNDTALARQGRQYRQEAYNRMHVDSILEQHNGFYFKIEESDSK